MPFVAPLFVPGDRPKRFAKAAASGADGVIIDLEDGVAPASKAAARDAMVRADLGGQALIVRINAAGTPWWDDDLAAVAQSRATTIMVPKAETTEALDTVRRRCGDRRVIIALIETAVGLDACRQLLRCPGVVGAAFGGLDLALDLGCEPDWEALAYARGQLVVASRLAERAAPIDGITPDFSKGEFAGRDAMRARRLGFGGKLLIHPRQVEPVLAAFLPSLEEIAWAKGILAAVAKSGGGAIAQDGAMIDRPIVERARRIMHRSG